MRLVRSHPLLAGSPCWPWLPSPPFPFSAVTVRREAHHDDVRDHDRVDVIVVPGAVQYDGTPSPGSPAASITLALLFEQGRAGTVFVLGAQNQPGDRTTEAEAGRDYLVAGGVPAAAVVPLPVGDSVVHEPASGVWCDARIVASRPRSPSPIRGTTPASRPWRPTCASTGMPRATWTSAARTEETRLPGYARETFAYLYYLVTGH